MIGLFLFVLVLISVAVVFLVDCDENVLSDLNDIGLKLALMSVFAKTTCCWMYLIQCDFISRVEFSVIAVENTFVQLKKHLKYWAHMILKDSLKKSV